MYSKDKHIFELSHVAFVELEDGVYMNKNIFAQNPNTSVPKEIVDTFLNSNIQTLFRTNTGALITNFDY